MTALMEEVIKRVESLPEGEQNSVASHFLELLQETSCGVRSSLPAMTSSMPWSGKPSKSIDAAKHGLLKNLFDSIENDSRLSRTTGRPASRSAAESAVQLSSVSR